MGSVEKDKITSRDIIQECMVMTETNFPRLEDHFHRFTR